MSLTRPITFVLAALTLAACARQHAPRFKPAEELSVAGDVGTAPMFAVSPSGTEAAAWVSAPNGGTDGRLYISVNDGAPVELRDSLGPIEPHGESPPKLAYSPDGSLNALYVVTRLEPGRRFPAAALRFVRSTDGGTHWSTPVSVTDDSTFGSHNFQALYAGHDGMLYASWLDGRTGKSTVFMTRSADGGKTWSPNLRVSNGEACPCCRTTMASAPDGTLYLAWRRVFPGNVRDIVVARSTNHGASWQEPVRAHADDWVFDGCPHAGPSLQVDDAGYVHIAWWTGKQGAAGVWYARSDDGARSFGTPVPLGVAEFSRPAHVQLALGGQDRLIAAWDDGTLATPRIVVRTSEDGGATWSPTATLSDSGKVAGFPVIAAHGERMAVAWSQERGSAPAHDEHMDMKDPNARMPLSAVGDAKVLVRRGTLE
jgi:BNR repeat protein